MALLMDISILQSCLFMLSYEYNKKKGDRQVMEKIIN